MAAASAPLTSEQLQARERWQDRWNLPIILAALVPLFVTSPKAHWVQVTVGLGSRETDARAVCVRRCS